MSRRAGVRVMAAITEPKVSGGLFDQVTKEEN